MSNYNREKRTKQELDAGLRDKILAMRKAANISSELCDEIEATIQKKDLDWSFAFRSVSMDPEQWI